MDVISQIKESLQMAQTKKKNLLFQERKHLDDQNLANQRDKSHR